MTPRSMIWKNSFLKKQDEFLKGQSHKSNSKGKSKDFISKS